MMTRYIIAGRGDYFKVDLEYNTEADVVTAVDIRQKKGVAVL